MAKKLLCVALLVLVVAFVTGCAVSGSEAPAQADEEVELLSQGQGVSAGQAQGEEAAQAAGEDVELLMGEGAAGADVDTTGEGEGDNINSSGEVITGNTSNEESGSTASGYGEEGGPVEREAKWIDYKDAQFGFTVVYPDTFVILEETEDLSAINATLAGRVRFQTRDLAKGDTAALELPQFEIEVYDNVNNLSLGDYIDQYSEPGERTEYEINGLKGFEVAIDHPLTPNVFYYFAHEDYVYKLIPLGQYSENILESFQISQ
jgi:hypothetical protein